MVSERIEKRGDVYNALYAISAVLDKVVKEKNLKEGDIRVNVSFYLPYNRELFRELYETYHYTLSDTHLEISGINGSLNSSLIKEFDKEIVEIEEDIKPDTIYMEILPGVDNPEQFRNYIDVTAEALYYDVTSRLYDMSKKVCVTIKAQNISDEKFEEFYKNLSEHLSEELKNLPVPENVAKRITATKDENRIYVCYANV